MASMTLTVRAVSQEKRRARPGFSRTRRAALRLLVLGTLALLGGCGARPGEIADLERYPQHASAYLAGPEARTRLVSPETQARLDAEYDRRFFAPWHQERASLPADKAFWGVASYGQRQGYGENLLPLSSQRWQELVDALQRESYPSLARPAITVRNSACRVFPTGRPFFFDPNEAGEGYPFDYFQNSTLWVGTPLLVTHRSRDGAWLFVEAGFVSGWLPAQDLAWADEAFRSAYQRDRYAALLHDDLTLRDEGGDFLAQTHIGAIFPLAQEDAAGLRVLVPVRAADGGAALRTAALPATAAAAKPLPLQRERIAEVADHMLGQSYGWGGLYENRDCSSTLRDLFTPFGIWLPRSSQKQAKSGGTFIDLSGLAPEQKRARLLRQGIGFYTLVWLPGHIGLYLGPDPKSGEPLLLQNIWGVKTIDWRGREGRALIGRLAITSLRPGAERGDVADDQFLLRIQGMTLLPGIETMFPSE